jgi:GH25 family lysozyme M1 (1,4-beta-N-acetylmuramidase)
LSNPTGTDKPRSHQKKKSDLAKKALVFFNKPVVCVVGCIILACILIAHLVIWNLPNVSESPTTAQAQQLSSAQQTTDDSFTLIAQEQKAAESEAPKEEQKSVAIQADPPATSQAGSLIGIDVSEHQGLIDWEAVAGNGVKFAFIRVGARGYTDGTFRLDSYFDSNIQAARAAGIKVGVYFYSQALNENEAIEEAAFVLNHLNGSKLDYPIAYDLETAPVADGRVNSLSGDQWTRNAKAFCELIEAAGYTPMLYGNRGDLLRYSSSLLSSYDIWFAQYDVLSPSAPVGFTIWQFTSKGTIAGISTFVDINIQSFNGDLASAGVVFHE